MNPAHYRAQSAHNTEKHPAHYNAHCAQPTSLKARADAVLRGRLVMCECATPRNAHSHITSENRTLPRTLPAHCNNDTALDLLQNLHDRGLDIQLDDAGRLLVTPVNLINDTDRAAIRHHLPALKRLVSCDYSDRAEGWQLDHDMPNRAFLVRNGRLLDSCLFRTTTGALELLRRLAVGEPLNLAFHAACAFEDACDNHDRDRPSQTESQNPITPHRKTAS